MIIIGDLALRYLKYESIDEPELSGKQVKLAQKCLGDFTISIPLYRMAEPHAYDSIDTIADKSNTTHTLAQKILECYFFRHESFN